MRYCDPVVEEVRTIRDAIAKELDAGIERLAQAIKAREAQSSRKIVL